MNVLLIGSGGREHALAWALKRSPKLTRLYILPGNSGIHRIAEPVAIPENDFEAIAVFCKKAAIDYVVVGPEAPLVAGITDYLEAKDIHVFGPSQKAAQLEGSKYFTKELCTKYAIPTAAYGSFTEEKPAKAYIKKHGAPIVIKADGLAAGKGVIIAQTEQEASAAIDEIFSGKFGAAGKRVVIEEYLEGEEASFFAISDGSHVIPFGSAQDHKRAGEGDVGPNTGGMGAYSPTPAINVALQHDIMRHIIIPTVQGLAAEGIPYKGILFAGLMLTSEGPKLLEYNIRFGDPETQVLMPRLETDLLDVISHACSGTLHKLKVQWSNQTALCVVMAAKGYPEKYEKGTQIGFLENAEKIPGAFIFHAGTTCKNDQWLATGGRVLGITALGDNVAEAQKNAYKAVDAIDWPGGFCRRDIGWRAVQRLKQAG